MSLLGALGNAVKGAIGNQIIPGSAVLASHIDPTPGFSATNVVRTQVGNLLGGSHQSGASTPTTPHGQQVAPSPYQGGSGSGAGTSSWTPQDQASYDQAVGVANAGLSRLPNQLAIARANVQDQFDQKYNGLRSGLAQAEQDYQQGVTQNQQQHLTNENGIKQGANSSYQSLLRILGGLGAGGGSEAKYLVPNLVGQQASQQLGGAGRTYAENAASLDKTIKTYQADEQNQEKSLNDWRQQQFQQAESTADANKQGLLQTLAQLASKKGGPGAAQPYLDQINSLASQIDNLTRFSPTFNGEVPVYTAPDLSSFQISPFAQAQVQNQAQQAGSNTPFLSLLLNGDQRRQDQLPGLTPAAA